MLQEMVALVQTVKIAFKISLWITQTSYVRIVAHVLPRPHVQSTMSDSQKKRLIEALKKVEMHGDVAPWHVQDPMTMVLRQKAVEAHLIRWDDGRGRYVLTGTGRRRLSARNSLPGVVIPFKALNRRDD